MRHNFAGKKLNRDTEQRKALFKNLVSALIEHGEVTTTEAKAKAVKGLVDKLIHKAQAGTVAARRVLAAFFGKREVVNKLVDQVAPAMKDRTSGFTSITRTAHNRRGDDTTMVKMELMAKPLAKPEVAKKEVKKAVVQKATKKVETKTEVKPAVKAEVKKAVKEVKATPKKVAKKAEKK